MAGEVVSLISLTADLRGESSSHKESKDRESVSGPVVLSEASVGETFEGVEDVTGE